MGTLRTPAGVFPCLPASTSSVLIVSVNLGGGGRGGGVLDDVAFKNATDLDVVVLVRVRGTNELTGGGISSSSALYLACFNDALCFFISKVPVPEVNVMKIMH